MAGIEITILPEFRALGASERKATLVVQLSPPPAPKRRAPVRIVLALDVSGSMAGDKIRTAILSAQALVRSLGPEDSFACVSFSDNVKTLVPTLTTTASGKALACEKLQSAHAEGSTDLAAAALQSLTLANEAREGGRTLLLTDGCPTCGVIEGSQIIKLISAAMGRSTLSTFGFGRDVDAPILSGLAEVGHGNYTFIENGEPPMAAIGAELGGMLLTVAADVSLSFKPAPGVKVERIVRADGVTIDATTGETKVTLPPLIAEEPVFVVIDLSWRDSAVGQPLGLLTAKGRLTEDGSLVVRESRVTLDTLPSRGAAVPDAIREIIVARAAVLLDRMSRGQTHPFKEAIRELTEQGGELLGVARAAGIENDPQVIAALAMIQSAREAFENNASDARQDMVASAAALKFKKSTYAGSASRVPYGTFITRSQVIGAQIIQGNQNAPAPQAPNPQAPPPDSSPDDNGPNSRR